MHDDEYWKFGIQETACLGIGVCVGAVFGVGLLLVKPAPPWWFLPLPRRRIGGAIDTWQLYQIEGGYEAFWVQSTWGWAIVLGLLGLVFSNRVLRKKA